MVNSLWSIRVYMIRVSALLNNPSIDNVVKIQLRWSDHDE